MPTRDADLRRTSIWRRVYRPDCDYVDGRVVERNLGERDHSKLQAAIAAYF